MAQTTVSVGKFRNVPVVYDPGKRQFTATVAGRTFRRATQRDLERILQQVLDSKQKAIRLKSDGACPEVVRVVFVHEKSSRVTIVREGRNRQQELTVVALTELRAYADATYAELLNLYTAMEEAQSAFYERLKRLAGFVGQSVAEDDEQDGESEQPITPPGDESAPSPEEEVPFDDTDPFAEPNPYEQEAIYGGEKS